MKQRMTKKIWKLCSLGINFCESTKSSIFAGIYFCDIWGHSRKSRTFLEISDIKTPQKSGKSQGISFQNALEFAHLEMHILNWGVT